MAEREEGGRSSRYAAEMASVHHSVVGSREVGREMVVRGEEREGGCPLNRPEAMDGGGGKVRVQGIKSTKVKKKEE